MSAAQSELYLQSFLEERARQIAVWANKCRVACVIPEDDIPTSVNSILVQLVSSRVCNAQECIALVAVNRSSCRSLGKFDALAPLFDLISKGFAEIQFLSDNAASCWRLLDACSDCAKFRLHNVTKADLVNLRVTVNSATPARPFEGQLVLEIASQILQPTQKIHDCFAVRRLVADLRVAERAALFGPWQSQQLQVAHRQRIRKQFATHSEAISAFARKADALGALAAWLQVVNQSLCDLAKIRETYRVMQAVSSHIVPMAKWALRPHGRHHLFGRPKPPEPFALPPPMLPQNASVSFSSIASDKRDKASAPRSYSPKAPASRPQSARSRLRNKVAEARDGVFRQNLNDEWNKAPTSHDVMEAPVIQELGTAEMARQEPIARKSPSLNPDEALGPGLGATRRLELWLREHGGHARLHHPASVGDIRQVPATSLLPDKGKHGPTSTCSTASTEAEIYSEHQPRVSYSSASSSVGTSSAPCSTFPSPAVPFAPEVSVSSGVAAFTESPCALLELSSDEEDIFDLGAHSPLDIEGTSITGSRALHMRSQSCN